MKYGWITLRVSDMDKSLAFYRDLLGFAISNEFGNGTHRYVFLGEGDNAKIELIGTGEKIDNAGNGFSVGVEVSDLDAMIDKIQKNTCIPASEPFSPNPSIRFSFVSDPDGYQVQLYENL